MGTGTKKYVPKAGNADRLEANIPVQDIVLGAKQFPNPGKLEPHWDTDQVLRPVHLPGGARMHTDSALPEYDISNPPKADIFPPLVRDF